ncbi:MAG: hypothetical protein J3R72DRAFT_498684 [Linnemannia gamsii]|nr:MAG: hypothetical protein J3R72DRAFT_498684 [Linnemannia gamsii]
MLVPFRFHQFRTVAWICGSWSLLAVTVMAQSPVAPYSTCCMGYTTIDENTFYILGGIHYSDYDSSAAFASQFHSLDLTQSGWDTSSPPWKVLTYPTQLAPLTSTRSQHSISVSVDHQTFTLWATSTPNIVVNYSIQADTWTQPLNRNLGISGYGIYAVTDPTTGLVYIPGAGNTYSIAAVYNFATGITSYAPSSQPLVTGSSYYSVVWSEYRGTFIYFSGNSTANPFFEFRPSTGQWSALVTAGSIPPFKLRSCLMAAYNGTKIILFGGESDLKVPVGTLHILDVPTMIWREGPTAPEARSEMACSVSEDNFLVWGGYRYYPPLSTAPNFGFDTTNTNASTTEYSQYLTMGLTSFGAGYLLPSNPCATATFGAEYSRFIHFRTYILSRSRTHLVSYDHLRPFSVTYVLLYVRSNSCGTSSPYLASRTSSPPTMRAPQATTETGSGATDRDLLEQINFLQAEWIRRQANQ